jgi:hypothetical protein
MRLALTLLLISSNDLTSSGFGMYSELQGKRRHGTHPVPRKFPAIYRCPESLCILKRLCRSSQLHCGGSSGESATEVLPNLRDPFLDRPALSGSVHIQEAMQPFVACTTALRPTHSCPSSGSAGSGLVIHWLPVCFFYIFTTVLDSPTSLVTDYPFPTSLLPIPLVTPQSDYTLLGFTVIY